MFIVCSDSAPLEKRKKLEELGIRFLTLDHEEGQIDLAALVQELGKIDITSLLIEGGSRVNGSALRADIVDKVYMFYAPKICGGEGIPICAGPGVEVMEHSTNLEDITVHRFADDVMIEGYVKHTDRE
jgi:diaminohydroxyphosphoribosylaminopyrimidine deaminase/5-amino-6-(5-phosphoribosylamino)uracil reductase